MTPLASQQLEASQALMTWLASRPAVQELNLVYCGLDPSIAPQPRYPADPVNELPAVHAQNHSADNVRAVNYGLKAVFMLSLWVRARQTPGANAQEALMAITRVLESELLNHPAPFGVMVCGPDQQTPAKVSYPDQLSHPICDEPRLRVSVAEILVQITANS